MPAQAKVHPQEVNVIMDMLKEFGIAKYQPGVLGQFLEFGQRYVLSVLEDARMCSEHAQKRCIDHDDLKLGVMMQLEKKFTTPPPRDLMLEVARTTNNFPLPYMKQYSSLQLPPKLRKILNCRYKPWKQKPPEPPRMLNFFGRRYIFKVPHLCEVYVTRAGKTYIKHAGAHCPAHCKVYQYIMQKKFQQAPAPPPKPRVYPSQQVPPLPFPYPKYMKPIIVKVKEEPASPIPEVENDVPPEYDEDED